MLVPSLHPRPGRALLLTVVLGLLLTLLLGHSPSWGGGTSTGIEVVATAPSPAPAHDLALTTVDGRTLAVVATDDGVWVVDVSDPASPMDLALVDETGSLIAVATFLTVAYLTGEEGGLRIVSLDDPDAPSLLSTRDAPARARSLAVDRGRSLLFAAHPEDGITAYSVASPLSPVEVARADEAPYVDLALDPTGVLLSAGVVGTSVHDVTGLTQLPPLPIRWLRYLTHRDAAPAAVAVIPGGTRIVVLDGTPGGALRVHDRARTTAPTLSGSLTLDGETNAVPRALTVIDDHALVAGGSAGVQLVDVLDPETPWSVGRHPLSGPGDVTVAVATDGTRVLALERSTGLHALALSPLAATVTGTLTVAGSGSVASTTTVSVPALGLSVRSDQGAYRLRLPPGTHEVHFRREIYAPDSTSVTVAAGETIEVDRSLTALDLGTVRGSVIREEEPRRRHPEGTLVTFVGTTFAPVQAFDGVYRRFFTPPGEYLLEANEFGFDPVQARVQVLPGPATVQDFVLPRSPVVETFEEGAPGWSVGGDAGSGGWVLADPQGTGAGDVQPDADETPGQGDDAPRFAFVTGNAGSGAGLDQDDVDGGCTLLVSPAYDLTGVVDPHLRLYFWFRNDVPFEATTPDDDGFRILASVDDGITWTGIHWQTHPQVPWGELTVPLAPFLGAELGSVRLRVDACDLGHPSVVEAALDDLSLLDGSGLLEPVPLPALHGVDVSSSGQTFRARSGVTATARVMRAIDLGPEETLTTVAVTPGDWIETHVALPTDGLVSYRVVLETSDEEVTFGPFRVLTDTSPPPPPSRGVTLVPSVTRGSTTLTLTTPSPVTASVEVFDVAGRRLVRLLHEAIPAGSRSLTWDGRDAAGNPVSAGVLFVRIRLGDHSVTRRLVRVP